MSNRAKFEFTGAGGERLAALLESPSKTPVATALFAHCFTCGKDIAAASRISRALVKLGYAVVRFDFTGLGNSDGDFANTNFSSNVQDIVAAANHLRTQGLAPTLLIGHSLGGTAVLNAAHEIEECRGIVTIGSPADASHVAAQFSCDIETIESTGEAEVNLAGRKFTIKKQFLDDIKHSGIDHISKLKRSLLLLHSPVDATVSIAQAERIYKSALHPKSFVSLEDADHLLTRAKDSEYVAAVIAAWASRLHSQPSDTPKSVTTHQGEVFIREKDKHFMLDVFSDDHHWLADEPTRVGGKNTGPDPYEHLLAALGTCTVMTVRMYADRKRWSLEDVEIRLTHSRQHVDDCENCADHTTRLDIIDRQITFKGDLDGSQRKKLLEIADKCPVHKTLTGVLQINTVELS